MATTHTYPITGLRRGMSDAMHNCFLHQWRKQRGTWCLCVKSCEHQVATAAPEAIVLTFDAAPNGTHYFLLITASGLGARLSTPSCPSGLSVAVGALPCDSLVMRTPHSQVPCQL